jgi:hypothetical protein
MTQGEQGICELQRFDPLLSQICLSINGWATN